MTRKITPAMDDAVADSGKPEYIGSAISSCCIRLTNEDAIDLFNRVKVNTVVVVLAPGQGDSPTNPRVAFTGGRNEAN